MDVSVQDQEQAQLMETFRLALNSAVSRGGHSSVQEKVANTWVAAMREEFRKEWQYDPEAVWSHSDEPGFSLATVRESIKRTTLREGVTETQFGALTRYGVVKALVGGYNQAPTVYKDLALIVNSNSSEENYAPLYGSDIPDVVEDGEEAAESRLAGFQVRIKNNRYAKILAISKTLYEDDQTGQLKMESVEFGKRMAYAEEKASIVSVFNFGQSSNTKLPATNIAGTAIGQGNTTTTPGQLSQGRLEDAWTAASYITDPLNNLMFVEWGALLISKVDEILARKILQSMYNPTVPGGAGSIGYFMTDNVLHGLFKIFSTPFISTQAGVRPGIVSSAAPWALIQVQGKGMIFQNRTALKVMQELPNAGRSFDRNEVRLLTERRFGVGTIDGRSIFIGN